MYSRVYVEITNICNMHCSFCHGHSRTPRRMSEDEFSRVLSALDGQTQYVYYHLMGEPLTHPLLPKFIRTASERGFKSVVTTNGTLLKDRGEELLSSGVYKVNVSLHSFENGSDGSFKGLDDYMRSVCNFAEDASNRGVIVVLRLWNEGFDGGLNEKVYSLLRERFDGEWAKNTRGIRIRDKLHIEWGERFVWPDRDASDLGGEVFCYGLCDHFGILCDGTVVPCCMDSDGVIALGNIFEAELTQILSSERAQAIVRGFKKRTAAEDLCRRCSYARRF